MNNIQKASIVVGVVCLSWWIFTEGYDEEEAEIISIFIGAIVTFFLFKEKKTKKTEEKKKKHKNEFTSLWTIKK